MGNCNCPQGHQPPSGQQFICTVCESVVPVALTVVHDSRLVLALCYECVGLGMKYIVRHARLEERRLNRGGEPGLGLP